MEVDWSGRGNWGRLGARQQHRQPPPADSPSPDRTDPCLYLSMLQRNIHLIEIKNCEDTRHQNQLSVAQEQHKDLCTTLLCVHPLQHSHVGAFQGLHKELQNLPLISILSTMLLNLSRRGGPLPLSTFIWSRFRLCLQPSWGSFSCSVMRYVFGAQLPVSDPLSNLCGESLFTA